MSCHFPRSSTFNTFDHQRHFDDNSRVKRSRIDESLKRASKDDSEEEKASSCFGVRVRKGSHVPRKTSRTKKKRFSSFSTQVEKASFSRAPVASAVEKMAEQHFGPTSRPFSPDEAFVFGSKSGLSAGFQGEENHLSLQEESDSMDVEKYPKDHAAASEDPPPQRFPHSHGDDLPSFEEVGIPVDRMQRERGLPIDGECVECLVELERLALD